MWVDSMESDRNMIDRNPSDNNLLDTLSNAFRVLKSPKPWLLMSIWSLILMIIYTFLWVDNIIELGVFLVGIFFLLGCFSISFSLYQRKVPFREILILILIWNYFPLLVILYLIDKRDLNNLLEKLKTDV